MLAGLHSLRRRWGRILPASSSSQGLQVFLGLWLHRSDLRLCLHSTFSSVCVSSPVLSQWTPVIGRGPQAVTLFPRSGSQVLRLGLGCIFHEDTMQPSTAGRGWPQWAACRDSWEDGLGSEPVERPGVAFWGIGMTSQRQACVITVVFSSREQGVAVFHR